MIIFPLAMLAIGGWMIWDNATIYIPFPQRLKKQSLLRHLSTHKTD